MAEKHSNDDDLLHRSSVSAYQKGDLKTSLELVLKAIQINSNVPGYYNTFGVILAQAGREQAAIKAYRKAIELNNNYELAYNNLGTLYLTLFLKEKVTRKRVAVRVKPRGW